MAESTIVTSYYFGQNIKIHLILIRTSLYSNDFCAWVVILVSVGNT